MNIYNIFKIKKIIIFSKIEKLIKKIINYPQKSKQKHIISEIKEKKCYKFIRLLLLKEMLNMKLRVIILTN